MTLSGPFVQGRRFAAVVLVSIVFLPAMAQGPEDYAMGQGTPGFWGSVYLASGSSRLDNRDILLSDFRLLAPGSDLLQEDFAAYRQSTGFWWSPARSRAVVLNVGMHPFRSVDKAGPELRVGFTYVGGVLGTLEFERGTSTTIDTLSSGTSAVVFLVDSSYTRRYNMAHRAERVGLDASLIFRTSGRSRWTLHGGGGLGFGMRVNTRTTIDLEETVSVNYPGSQWRSEVIGSRSEVVDNSNGFWLAFQAPVGVGYRLAKQGNFLRLMDLYLEFRPGMLLQGSAELGTRATFGSQTFFGLRVRLE